jgi:transcriptional regulator with XRE-family HTH domain
MASTREPGAGARRLAQELERLRNKKGLRSEAVARRLGWSASKISRIERARVGLKVTDLERLLDLLEVPVTQRRELIALAEESRAPSQQEGGERRDEGDRADASLVLEWAPHSVPRLLETVDYASARLASTQAIMRTPPGAIAREVEATTLVWQRRLTSGKVLGLRAVIDEAVLRRRCGTSDVMVAQLQAITGAVARDNVEVRILPLAGDGPRGVVAFTYFTFPVVRGLALGDAVVVERIDGRHWRLEVEGETFPYFTAFSELWNAAAPESETAAMIEKILREGGA